MCRRKGFGGTYGGERSVAGDTRCVCLSEEKNRLLKRAEASCEVFF